MVFADLIFLFLFLPLNVFLYYMTADKNFRNVVLITFSLLFYAWGEPVWIVLLLFSATVDYVHGLVIERNRGKPLAKLMVVSSLVLNLGLLFIFKYSGFFVEIINGISGLSLAVPAFALPIGISFYTFQTISYTLDVYKGEVKAQRSYAKFLMFVSLYHQLVAGPVVRYADIAKEIDDRRETLSDLSRGLNRFLVGLGKKVIIANMAGQLASQFLDADVSTLTVLGSWLGVILFSIQIYYDFSGYSDMAIGLGWMFGFHYKENFNYPFIATSVADFWRRWHISLGSFFRDYLYIPLGGSRKHAFRNLFITWFATGLWHGASLNFVLWGLYFGVLLALERLFLSAFFERIPRVFSHVYLIVAVQFSWVLFYFTDLSKGADYFFAMLGFAGGGFSNASLTIMFMNNIFWFIAAVAMCAPIVPYVLGKIGALSVDTSAVGTVCRYAFNIAVLTACTALLVGQSYNPFLYFRF